MSASTKQVREALAAAHVSGEPVTINYKAAEGDRAGAALPRTVRVLSEVWTAKSSGREVVKVVHVHPDGPLAGEPETETRTLKDGTEVTDYATRTYRLGRITKVY